MVAYSFQGRFADAVERGEKRQTIRANGKRRHARPGDKLQLYTGMRTTACRKLRDAVCHDACPILIERDSVYTFHPPEFLDPEQVARLDGFSSWAEMRDWFDSVHGLPFRGVMIRWLVPPAEKQ
ncbi:MAG: hypothetical protein GHHEDOFH_01555 [Pseudorhodoplanes sp.]|nr:hypothetical protein [Pseudorhodoplanes sp.]